MLEAAILVPIINANNVVKHIRCAPVRILHGGDVPQYHSQIAQQGSPAMVGGLVCISQQIYGYLVHVRDKARTFWLSAI